MSQIVLRTANAADALTIAALHATSWRSAYANAMRADYLAGPIVEERRAAWEKRFSEQSDMMRVTLCELDDQPVGFVATFAPDGDQYGALLDNIHIIPNAKGQGFGALLFCSAAAWIAEGFPGTGLHLFVLKVNTPAQKFYDRMGGVVVEEGLKPLPDGGELANLRYYWKRPDLLAQGDFQ